MIIRATTPADLPFLMGLESRFTDLGLVATDDLDTHQRAMSNPDCAYWTIEVSGQRAGHLIVRGLKSPNRSIELRRLVMAQPGGGIGRRVLQIATDRSFNELGAHRVWLDVFVDNHRARRLYNSLGFVEEGTLRECVCLGGCYKSLVIVSMLEREYRDIQKTWQPMQ